ncbi:CobQ/CobB/MinD/ParA nucleotide binding domain-containing protein [Bifidobacterium avesanii]|nr:CobQ/CobB/MinD/ParA nucleotide binding domain-containing protein [Bifidobacterium avesanii]
MNPRPLPTPKPPPRYYADAAEPSSAPPSMRVPRRSADGWPDRAPSPDTGPDAADAAARNAIVCVCASGGAGLSVCAAMLALTLAGRGLTCALVDMDLARGGLDVLLGLEREQGMRMGDVEAPLGRIEGEALAQELPQWEGVRVLGADPWNGGPAQWWEAQAALTALAQVHDAVVVDGGDGACIGEIPSLGRSPALIVVELSVPGLARARSLSRRLTRLRDERAPEPWLLGVYPRGVPRRRAGVDADQAAAYLGAPLAGALEPKPSLTADLLGGLGIRAVPRAYRAVYGTLAGNVETALGRAGGRRDGRGGARRSGRRARHGGMTGNDRGTE